MRYIGMVECGSMVNGQEDKDIQGTGTFIHDACLESIVAIDCSNMETRKKRER
jgi:hypothetical protein